MSALLRSLLVLGVASLLMVGCGEKEEAAPEAEAVMEVAPEAAPVEAAPAEAAPAEAGGYVPTADELVPGITEEAAPAPAAE